MPGCRPLPELIGRLVPDVIAAGELAVEALSSCRGAEVLLVGTDTSRAVCGAWMMNEGTGGEDSQFSPQDMWRALAGFGKDLSGFLIAENCQPGAAAFDLDTVEQVLDSLQLASEAIGIQFVDHLLVCSGEAKSAKLGWVI